MPGELVRAFRGQLRTTLIESRMSRRVTRAPGIAPRVYRSTPSVFARLNSSSNPAALRNGLPRPSLRSTNPTSNAAFPTQACSFPSNSRFSGTKRDLRTKSCGGYPVIANSGVSTSSAPAAASRSYA